MPINKMRSSNKSAVPVNKKTEVKNTSNPVKQKAATQKKRRNKRRRSRKGEQPARAEIPKGVYSSSLSPEMSKNGSSEGRDVVLGPMLPEECTSVSCGEVPTKSKAEGRQKIRKENSVVKRRDRKIKPCQEKESKSNRYARNRGWTRKSRPEFERPISWLIENTARFFLGDIAVQCSRLLYSWFVFYNEILKPESKKVA